MKVDQGENRALLENSRKKMMGLDQGDSHGGDARVVFERIIPQYFLIHGM